MILLRRYKLRTSGKRSHAITIPETFVEQLGIESGQPIAMYRDGDKLVLVPEKKTQA